QQHRRSAADLFVDVFPAPFLLALDIENFLGEIGTCHGCSPLAFGRRIAVAHARCWTRPGRDGAGMSGTTGPRTGPPSAESSGAGRAAATCGAPGRTTGTRRRSEVVPF